MNVLPFELRTEIPAALSAFSTDSSAFSSNSSLSSSNSVSSVSSSSSPSPDLAATSSTRPTASSELPLSVHNRRGNSALYSAQSFLERDTKWSSVLVAWTGELVNYDDRIAAQIAAQPGQNCPSTDFMLSASEQARAESLLVDKAAENGSTIAPIFLYGGQQSRWRSYAEQVLWPLLHYIMGEPSDGLLEKQWWIDYVKFNEAFADKICSIYRPGDIIWVHDYHLLLLPQLLRQRLPKAYIGLFLHAPFPSSEYFRYLTKRRQLLEGMLGANMVSLQSQSYARHFISSCTRVLGFESTANSVDAFGSRVAITAYPIGIDAARVERDMDTPAVRENMNAIRELYPGKMIIVGRDRLDSVRGVIQKLNAFEMFCQMYPELVEKVVLIQITAPASAYQAKIEKKVSEMVAHINGVYGMLHFTPVQHYPQQIARDEYFALLRVADLALITSVRDAMNTTSLEYVVCQRDAHGQVILSEFTGTAGSLTDAITVNPWDSIGVAKAIYECLFMSAEQKSNLEAKLYKHVTTHTVQSWVSNFLAGLVEVLSQYDLSHMTPVLDRPLMLGSYQSAKRRLFMFDYDGTLTPIVQDPAAALPHPRVIDMLRKLCEDSKNQVWIISGRDQAFLEKYLGSISPRLGLSAEHGCFMRSIGTTDWINLTEQADMSWQKDVIDIFQYYTERTQGSFIERKRAAVTWHYRRADPDFGAFQARECQNHLENTVTQKYDVEVMTGKANLEVRPRFVNKGEIAKRLVEEYSTKHSSDAQAETAATVPDFILCMGDDSTDEDMFRALRKLDEIDQQSTFTVTIGPSSKMTTATWHLIDPHEVAHAVGALVGMDDIAAEMGSLQVMEEKCGE
ncbi:glycosyltransferase family 20-domain-containing protein [Lipomyces oligophaga]|uniref:glycosyltransferase family 20-domain-containing protein n=1 Tax=Lipomyces oligophaga TaxID=45792 RepID=UPI0034D00A06